jgi:hypothetical protein
MPLKNYFAAATSVKFKLDRWPQSYRHLAGLLQLAGLGEIDD